MRESLTTKEVARLLRVHVHTVRRWSDAGAIPVIRVGPRRDRRFERNEVVKLLREEVEPLIRLTEGEQK